MHILRLSMAQEVILWCGGNVNVMAVPALLCVNAKLNHITLQTGSLFLGIWQMDKNTVSCCTDTHTHTHLMQGDSKAKLQLPPGLHNSSPPVCCI